jgi:hypothetical protein
MRTYALRNGDLDLIGDRFAMVEGAARVQQQLGLCMREVWGVDRFHPGWGSVMPNWIGGVINAGLELDLRSEVLRIVKNQMSSATDQINRRANSGLAPVVVAGEIITNVSNIVVRQAQDQVFVRVVLVTASNAEFSLIINPGGAG